MDIGELPAWLALPVAAGAGLVSFASPCVAPLVPGYLAFVGGPDGSAPVGRAVAFVCGFSVVFTVLGTAAGGVAGVLLDNRAIAELVGGIVVALLGLAVLRGKPILPSRLAATTSHLHQPATFTGAFFVGAAFSVAWSPCIGPVLAAISTIAAAGSSAGWGAALLLAYSAGLAVPFLLIAVGLRRADRLARWLRTHTVAVRTVSGLVLVGMGTLMATGLLGTVSGRLASAASPLL